MSDEPPSRVFKQASMPVELSVAVGGFIRRHREFGYRTLSQFTTDAVRVHLCALEAHVAMRDQAREASK